MSIQGSETGFSRYVSNVITPILEAQVDDGEFAVWLNWQLDEWEAEVERPEGIPFARQVVAHLSELLSSLREQIKAKIAAAEAGLVGWPA